VQIRLTGDVAPDGMVEQQLVQIPVEAEATNIPQAIDLDIEGMEIGAAIHASDLKLPRGVSLQVDPETLILHVVNQVTAAEPEAEEDTGEVPEPVAEAAEERDGEQAG
jgi:large subunit ribosomal protein L25